ncbi:N-acetylneuraminic acid mutarotase [Pedobacter cryoconitis]|uniref:N-acetylneuraminic acid mutarotase n=1 Tax=Pedobacter cryoconitis TaxID=188932 RepID=A0A7W9DIT5_9SPHI|nr:kelch repeat-containing protein [Pedobacter cryoconitis]MBB5620467.1 N-acetylneuraminic acid mutarotase [Pedobacter cryoconitis]
MIKKLLSVSFMIAILFLGSCKKNKDDGPTEWVKGSDFEGSPRSAAASFIIDGKAYISGGFNGDKRLNDLWMYDPKLTNWFKIGDTGFPGDARNYAVGFSVGGKGYVGTGTDGTNSFKDFYQFTPETKQWKKIADFPGDARYGAVAFSGSGKGYVGSGTSINGDLKDFYSYNPATDSWTQITSLPGSKRAYAFTFTIGDLTYIGSGSNNGANLPDLWSYNTANDVWTKKNDIYRDDKNESNKKYQYDLRRRSATTFTIGQRAFLTGGITSGVTGTTWAYDPSTDYWDQHQDFGGVSREAAVGFGIGDKGYVTIGKNGSHFDDLWIFTPNK